MIIYVGGVNGVGKSTLLKSIAKRNPAYNHIKGSSLLMQELGILNDDYDALRKISDHVKNDKFGEAIINLAKFQQNKDETILIDAHYLNLIDGEIHKVIDYWIKFVDGVILIEAPVESIIARIYKDSSNRDRKLFKGSTDCKSQIKDYMLKTTDEFNHICQKYSLKHLVVNNPDGNIESPASKIVNFIENLK